MKRKRPPWSGDLDPIKTNSTKILIYEPDYLFLIVGELLNFFSFHKANSI
jgi:hypothetical protein